MSSPVNPLVKKKLPKGKVTVDITPGWAEDEPPYTTPVPDDGSADGQQYAGPVSDSKRKTRKLQRS